MEVENGLEALDLLRARPGDVDVVMLDVIMPELDGYATLEAMKSDEAIRHIPVIIVSGVEELESVVRRGAFAVRIEGRLRDGRVTLETARVGLTRLHAGQPGRAGS